MLPFLAETKNRTRKNNMQNHRRPLFLRLWCLGCVLLALCFPSHGWADDHILEKAWWTDTSGSASFEDAQAASYTPYEHVFSKGFSADAQWIRLKIEATPSGDQEALVLRLRPVYLDEITLFDPVALKTGQPPRTTGDWTPWQSTEFESLHHTFLIYAQPQPRYVWLRLTTTSTQLLHVEALTPREMLRQEHRLWLVYSGLLALILSFSMWVFLAWLRDRDPVNGMFVLRQAVLLAYTASYLGYHRILLAGVLEPRSQDVLYNVLVLLTTALSIIFEYRFLREYTLARWGQGLFRALLGVCVVVMGLFVFGQTRTALNLNMLLNAAGVLTMLAVALGIRTAVPAPSERYAYHLPKTVVVGYYSLVIGVLALSILPSLGVLQGSMLSIYGVLLYGLISGLFMTVLLIVRSRQLERLRLEAANSLFLSREQLAIEQKRRQDQTQLLSMLMHELKTPLSIIDMAVRTRSNDSSTAGYVSRAVGNIKGILDRCIQTDRMVEREFRLESQPVHLSKQLLQWVQDRREGAQRIDAQIEPGLELSSDLQCIQIIVNNLIDNALDHGDPQADIQVRLSRSLDAASRPGVLLVVANAPGPSGWPEHDKLFDKYYRSSSAQRRSGSGLGLYLSHNLAAQLGGTLRFRPDHDHICFELWLPI